MLSHDSLRHVATCQNNEKGATEITGLLIEAEGEPVGAGGYQRHWATGLGSKWLAAFLTTNCFVQLSFTKLVAVKQIQRDMVSN